MRLLRGREKPAAPRCPPAGAGTGCSVRGTLFPHGPRRVWRRSLSLCIRQSWVISNGFAITFACMLPPPRASLVVSLRAAAVAGWDGVPLLGGVRGCFAADTRGSAVELCGFPAGETSNLMAVSKPCQQTTERRRALFLLSCGLQSLPSCCSRWRVAGQWNPCTNTCLREPAAFRALFSCTSELYLLCVISLIKIRIWSLCCIPVHDRAGIWMIYMALIVLAKLGSVDMH